MKIANVRFCQIFNEQIWMTFKNLGGGRFHPKLRN